MIFQNFQDSSKLENASGIVEKTGIQCVTQKEVRKYNTIYGFSLQGNLWSVTR